MKNFPVFLTYIILEQPNRGGGSLLWPFPADPGVQELKGIYLKTLSSSSQKTGYKYAPWTPNKVIVINSFGPCTTGLVKADP